MARPKNTFRTEYIHIGLPEDLYAKVQLHLFSDIEGKVPLGAYQEFFTKLVADFFAANQRETIDE